MQNSGLCPNCASQMHKEQKKVFNIRDWRLCKSCGYRESDVEDFLIGSPDFYGRKYKLTLRQFEDFLNNLERREGVAEEGL